MKLKSLTIHNIASIEDAIIDFYGKELREAPIFLICGETGAGKTTILDSICLSLFGDTPRMSSISKEDVESSVTIANKGDKLFSNDNSQLLHRGAGEGYTKLIFEGNDGKDYEAIWEIHRAHNKAHKRLLRPTRQLRSIDGSYFENRIWEIKGKITELIGLTYDQFCRTVMLAQGEFTKFLKSNSAEKSEILEKLTGTEIYSRLGIRIAEKYNTLRSQCLELKGDIEKVKVLDDDERSEILNKRDSQKSEIDRLSSQRESLINKLGWLRTSEELKKLLLHIESNIKEITTCIESESFKDDKRLIKDYEESAEGRVILGNIQKTESLLKVKKELLPHLKEEEDKAWEAEKEAVEKGKELAKLVEESEKKIENLRLDDLAKSYHQIVIRENQLSSLITVLEKLTGEEKAFSILSEQEVEIKGRIEENNVKVRDLRSQVEEAEKEWKDWTIKLEKMELTLSDLVKELRNDLQIGSPCPVCGSIVEHHVTDSFFESLLSPVKEAKIKAEEKFMNLGSNLKAIDKLLKTDNNTLKKLESKIKASKESLDLVRKDSVKVLEEAGMSEMPREKAFSLSIEEKDKLKQEIDFIRHQQSEGEKISGELKNQRGSLNELNKKIDEIKDLVVKTRLARQSLHSEIETYTKSQEEQEKTLEEFCGQHTSIGSIENLKKIADFKPEVINDKRVRIETAENSLKTEIGKREAIENQIKAHAENSPEFTDDETPDLLNEEKDRIERLIKETSEENGRIKEILERDLELKKNLSVKKVQYEKVKDQLESWNDLYENLGDMKGVRFRSVAQSFILRSLLDNANLYMKCFNDRYTLTCNPGSLVILVKDSFNPGEAQPSSILSGGESFMASLSLALALSNLRSGGMSVDILFIDEGFGTLSSDYLENVMETLEKLHQIGGRKVGLISHVSELKDRIPVHIQVRRETPAMSRVEVIENYS